MPEQIGDVVKRLLSMSPLSTLSEDDQMVVAGQIAGSMMPFVEANSVARGLLERAGAHFEESAPDPEWWRDYFLLTGERAVLTEDGWITWECYQQTADEYRPEILKEVNAPRY